MIGQTVSHYRIVEKLGQGGMGVVYKALDSKLRRPVALKFLAPELLSEVAEIERFKEEACAASAINHPNICTIHDIDRVDGRWFIVMEYLEGETLAQRLGREILPLTDVLDLAIQTCEALLAAHKRGIVHGDVKPSNLFLTKEKRVKLLDFGLSKAWVFRVSEEDRTEKLEPSPTISGTLKYMSPEQARGLETDCRSDIFSFGIVLYQMVTGERPFEGDTSVAILSAILTSEPRPIHVARPEAPEALQGVIHKCLRKDPELRFQHTHHLLEDLKRVRSSLESPREVAALVPQAVAPGQRRVRPSRSSKRRLWTAVAVVATVIAAVVMAVTILPRQGRRTGPRRAEGRQTMAAVTDTPGSGIPVVSSDPNSEEERAARPTEPIAGTAGHTPSPNPERQEEENVPGTPSPGDAGGSVPSVQEEEGVSGALSPTGASASAPDTQDEEETQASESTQPAEGAPGTAAAPGREEVGEEKPSVPSEEKQEEEEASPLPGEEEEEGEQASPLPSEEKQQGEVTSPVPGQEEEGEKTAPVPSEEKEEGDETLPVPSEEEEEVEETSPVPSEEKEEGEEKSPEPSSEIEEGPAQQEGEAEALPTVAEAPDSGASDTAAPNGKAIEEFDFQAFWTRYAADFADPVKFRENYTRPEVDTKWYRTTRSFRPHEVKFTKSAPLGEEDANLLFEVEFKAYFVMTESFLQGRSVVEPVSEVWVINPTPGRIVEVRQK
jgi:hypothetical protein